MCIRDRFSVVSEKISHSSPTLFWSKVSEGVLGGEYGSDNMFDRLAFSLVDGFGAVQDTRNITQATHFMSWHNPAIWGSLLSDLAARIMGS